MKCEQCGKEGDLPIYDCGLNFCSSQCRKLYRYCPNMTDETFKEETTIDEIELDGGKEWIELQTPDGFYTVYSGYKVIVVQYRVFWHKQLCGFRTVKEGQQAWAKLKQKNGWKSWADLNSEECISR